MKSKQIPQSELVPETGNGTLPGSENLSPKGAISIDDVGAIGAIIGEKAIKASNGNYEIYFQQFLNMFPVAVYTCDEKGCVKYFNYAAVELFGHVPQAGKDLWSSYWRAFDLNGKLLTADKYPMAVALKECRQVFGRQLIIERPDGSRRTVMPYPQPILNEDNQIVGGINVVIDITSHKQIEQNLKEIEIRYEQLIQGLPAAIYTCDANGYILLYNKAAADLWGREPQIGKDLWCGSWKIYKPDGTPLPLDQCPMAIALKEGRMVQDEEIIVERPDGQKRNIMPHPKPFFNSEGKVAGAVNMLVDITDRKITEERNGHFAAIVQYSDDAIISKTLEGIITSWNNAAERIFGYTAEEMIGTHITRILPPDRLDEEPVILERLKRGERIDHFETKRITKDRRLLDISLTISPVKDSNGRVIGASKIARDITAQKKAEQRIRENEERIRESEERLRLAAEAAELGMWDLDLKTGLAVTSSLHRRIMGYPQNEPWNNDKYMDLVHPEDRDMVDQAFKQARSTGTMAYEARIIRADKSERWIRVNGTTIYDKNQTPVRMLGTILDITEQKKAKEDLENKVLERTKELLHTNEQLEKSNHELEQFAYIASHDLQEPLRKIQTFADLVKDHLGDKATCERYFSKINSSAQRMSMLINDVLNYSRLTKDGEQFVNTDLNKVLKDVLSDFELLIEQKQATITYTPLPVIQGIPLQLNQLFSNLLSNSLKFTQNKPQISITSKMLSPNEIEKNYPKLNPEGNYIELLFQDSGIGFEQQYAEQIFIIFQRLNSQKAYSGTGIGLALCKKIVEYHDGIIMANSEKGQGAAFTVVLPVSH